MSTKKNYFLPKNQLEDLLHNLSVVIQSETSKDILCYCPFHKNKDTPAFAISIRGPHLWKCNNGSCGKQGNIITLLTLKGYSFSEAEKMVLKSTFEVDDLERVVRDLLGEDEDELNGWEEINPATFQEVDKESGFPALQYLEKRGVSFDAYDYFKMGYSKNKDMVVIPVFDEKHFLVGVIGREIHTKRYQYSNGLSRGKLIWNINNAKAYDSIILTEGALDAVAIWQAGFHNVGAVLGSSISPNQWSQLGKYFSEIICFFDNDDAGKSLRDLIIQNIRDLSVRYVEYPDRMITYETPSGEEFHRQLKDPGELTEAEISDMVTNSLSSIDWLLNEK